MRAAARPCDQFVEIHHVRPSFLKAARSMQYFWHIRGVKAGI
jgi:hypothetical protein